MNDMLKALDFLKDIKGHEFKAPSDAIYAEGPNSADICFIGEAPGGDEETSSRPFVGPAGRELNRLLHTCGISRSSCRLENVLQFRPYQNDISPYISFKPRKGVVFNDIYTQSVANLKARLAETTCKVLVPLGNVPMHALTGNWGITKWRGSILDSTLLPGRKVIPTIHPSATFKKYVYSYFIAYDLLRIKRESAYPDRRLMKRKFYLSPTLQEVLAYIKECHKQPMIGYDIECTRETPQVTHISLAISPENAICIPFFDRFTDNFTPDQEARIWVALSKLMSDTNVVKVGHNLAFDNTFIHRRYGICTRPFEDTMIGMRIAFPDFPMNLGFAISLYCEGEPYHKDTMKKWAKNPFETTDEFRRYNAMDSAAVMEIYPKLMSDLKRQGNFEAYVHQTALVEPLTYMANKGMLIDVEEMARLRLEASLKADKLHKELEEKIGHEINPKSTQQVGHYFYEELGLPKYYKKNKDGSRSVTTDITALKRIAGKGYTEASTILEIRHQRHLVSSFYSVQLDSDNRMRCSFNPVGTVQGRISSSESIFGGGTNLLNQPPEMKKLMIPDPGYIMINIDLAQAENVTVAYLWKVLRMIKAFEEGIDVHKQTAALIFDKPISEISNIKGSTDIGFGKYSERDIGKRSNHGFNYGLGPDTFALDNQISQADAKQIQYKYHYVHPEIKQGHRATEEELRAKGYLINMYGRKRYFKEQWGHKLFMKAYNYVAQSTVADHLNRHGFCFMYYSKDPKMQLAELLNQVYDSILFQYPLSAGVASLVYVLQIICHQLETPLIWKGKDFIIPADVSTGKNAYNMKEFTSKEVYATFNFTSKLKELYYA